MTKNQTKPTRDDPNPFYATLMYYPHEKTGYLWLHREKETTTLAGVNKLSFDDCVKLGSKYTPNHRFERHVGCVVARGKRGGYQDVVPMVAVIRIYYDPELIAEYFPDFLIRRNAELTLEK